jgi:formylglycine-generating enzyme required for sulfatase activity
MCIAGCGGSDESPAEPAATSGSVVISVLPSTIEASWTLDGPKFLVGAGDTILTDAPVGSYRLNWWSVSRWLRPDNLTGVLTAGGELQFTGTYTSAVGVVEVSTSPEDLEAEWTIRGPNGFAENGVGHRVFEQVAIGDYTVYWQAITGWTGSETSTATLNSGGSLVFECVYTEIGNVEIDGFTLIPPVSESVPILFEMGSDLSFWEPPVHMVTLTNRVYISTTEVTNAEYVETLQWAIDLGYAEVADGVVLETEGYEYVQRDLLILDSPYCGIVFADGVFSTSYPERPVETITWYGAAAYCNWLSERQGLPRVYDNMTWSCNDGGPYGAAGYRLPTEAEWELSCRAGTTTLYSTGDSIDPETQANFSSSGAVDVGSYLANPWGLFDMHGNVREWCGDWLGYYTGDVINPFNTNPSNPVIRNQRIQRGGNWSDSPFWGRSAARRFGYPDDYICGFRVVRSRVEHGR